MGVRALRSCRTHPRLNASLWVGADRSQVLYFRCRVMIRYSPLVDRLVARQLLYILALVFTAVFPLTARALYWAGAEVRRRPPHCRLVQYWTVLGRRGGTPTTTRPIDIVAASPMPFCLPR
jgi:hypothetical protein